MITVPETSLHLYHKGLLFSSLYIKKNRIGSHVNRIRKWDAHVCEVKHVSAESTAACVNKNCRFDNFQSLSHSKWLMNGFLFLLGNTFYITAYTVFETAQSMQFLFVEQIEQAIKLENYVCLSLLPYSLSYYRQLEMPSFFCTYIQCLSCIHTFYPLDHTTLKL